jgi:hypothetical protein
LEDGQTENFSVIDFGSRAGTRDEFTVTSGDTRLDQGVVQSAIAGRD